MPKPAEPLPLSKYHGLGNDYVVVDAVAHDAWLCILEPDRARRLCDRHTGVGSDGILLREPGEGHRLRIINPDGSEAEKSGNGLRIFGRYLYDRGLVDEAPFAVTTPGGRVRMEVAEGGASVKVEMGSLSFSSDAIPVRGPSREVVDEPIDVAGERYHFTAATVGNPHCVVTDAPVEADTAKRIGPLLERHPLFPNRTNVQLLEVLDRDNLRLEIWERGAGYTLASGSSSCAAAAAARRLGLCNAAVSVHMPGGALEIAIAEEAGGGYAIEMRGPVELVWRGEIEHLP